MLRHKANPRPIALLGVGIMIALLGGVGGPPLSSRAQTVPAPSGEFRVATAAGGRIAALVASGHYVAWSVVRGQRVPPAPGPTPPGAPPTYGRPAPPPEVADLYAADLSAGPPRIIPLAAGLPPATRVSIDGARVVWSTFDPIIGDPISGPFSRVVGLNLATGQPFAAPASGGNQFLPTITGDWVIWSGAPAGNGPGIPENQAILAWNLRTGERRTLDTYLLEPDPARSPAPAASGNRAAYIIRLPGRQGTALRLYDFAGGQARTIHEFAEGATYNNLRLGAAALWEMPAPNGDPNATSLVRAGLSGNAPSVGTMPVHIRAGSLSVAGSQAVWQAPEGPVVGWTIDGPTPPQPLTAAYAEPAGLTAITPDLLAWYDMRDHTPAIYTFFRNTPPPPPVADPFARLWARSDEPVAAGRVARSWVWGPRPEGLLATDRQEPYRDAPGLQRLVRYYDKGRMELNDPQANPATPWYVTSGLLVVEMISGQVAIGDAERRSLAPNALPVAGDPGSPAAPSYATLGRALPGLPPAAPRSSAPITTWMDGSGAVSERPAPVLARYGAYDETAHHNIADVFLAFMHQRGPVNVDGVYRDDQLFDPLFTFGYPIMEPVWITVRVGGQDRAVLFQAFERRTLTYTPSNPPAWQVEMGNVGLHYYTWRYGAGGQ